MMFKNFVAVAAATLMSAAGFAAQAYPDKAVKIIVPYNAGQGTDIAARYFADYLSKDLGQSFFVENRGGAGGNIGTQAAARAEPDGYTITMGTNATHALNAFLYDSLPYDAKADFEPIMLVGTFPMAIVAGKNASFSTIPDILEAVKKSNRAADIGMPSTTARLVYELLKEQSKADLFGVPYKGSSLSITNLIGGEIALSIDTVTAVRPQIEGDKLKAIAVTSANPSNLLPGVPTVAEQGLPGFEVIAWNALYAPKGTPKEVVATLNASLQKFLDMPETQQRLLSLGYEAGGGSPERLAEFAESERQKWGPIIKKAGIKIN